MQLRAKPTRCPTLARVALALFVSACGGEPAEAVLAPTATGPVILATPPDVAPSHEGTVVMAGAYPVEVVPHASGEVYAYVLGDAPAPDDTELAVVVPVRGGVRTVELDWDRDQRRWGGQVRHVEIVPGPVDVVVVASGTRWVGHSTTFVVRPAVVVVTAPVVVAPAPVIVVPVYEERHDHGKHLGWSHGHGHGHGHGH